MPTQAAETSREILASIVHVTQRATGKMARRVSGHVVTLTTSLVSQPVAGVSSALPVLPIDGGAHAGRWS